MHSRIGLARDVEISIYGEKCKMDFLVVENKLDDIFNVVLGVPWCNKMNVGIIFSENNFYLKIGNLLKFIRKFDTTEEKASSTINNILDKHLIEVIEKPFPKRVIGKEFEIGNENNKLQFVDANTQTDFEKRINKDEILNIIINGGRINKKVLESISGNKEEELKVEIRKCRNKKHL